MASLAPLDLAALLCSRVCHDVISPVGAIVNGLEVLDGEQDEEMRAVAMELIKKSAISASARLQFCRLAFGAAGSFGASIDTGDAEKVAREVFASDRTSLQWTAARRLATLDAARPEAVAKRRKTGHWTARENINELLDVDTFLEYGQLARPAMRWIAT